jgi:hypothetical protein
LNQNIVLSSILIKLLENKYALRFGNNPKGYTNNMILHFINKKNVIKLLLNYINKTNVKYDIIMSLRFELLVHDKFDFSYFINNRLNNQNPLTFIILMMTY